MPRDTMMQIELECEHCEIDLGSHEVKGIRCVYCDNYITKTYIFEDLWQHMNEDE